MLQEDLRLQRVAVTDTRNSSCRLMPVFKLSSLLTSHAHIKWIQSCCKHFDNHLIGIVDDGETGVFSEA